MIEVIGNSLRGCSIRELELIKAYMMSLRPGDFVPDLEKIYLSSPDSVEEFVRDLTSVQVSPLPKSKVRARINSLLTQTRNEVIEAIENMPDWVDSNGEKTDLIPKMNLLITLKGLKEK